MKGRKTVSRTPARELALQGLFMLDVQGDAGLPAARGYIVERSEDAPDARDYALQLLEGTWRMRTEIDAQISRTAERWDLSRIAVADRSILRLALYELTRSVDVPPKVAVNEAIELAKRFSTGDSSRFVNGILDKLMNSDLKWRLAGPLASQTGEG